MPRAVAFLLTVAALMLAAWIGAGGEPSPMPAGEWLRVAEGVYRSRGFPTTYAVVGGDRKALLIGATAGADLDALEKLGVDTVRGILLTHHDRDSTAQAAAWIARGIPVRAPKASVALLTVDGVSAWWKTSLPAFDPENPPGLRDRSFGAWDDWMPPRGIDGVRCSLAEGDTIRGANWSIDVLSAPGHSRDHAALVLHGSEKILFCGDALAARGKLWAPYSTDWHHCFNEGLDNTAATLKKLAALEAAILCPEHGPPIVGKEAVRDALLHTAALAEEAGRFKSYEWYTKERVGNPPKYEYLAPDQVATAGEKPWTRISEHLYLTGNTYALASKDGALLIIDPFGEKIAAQVQKLREERGLGPVEVVVISHAHNDHYTGAFLLPGRDAWKVWTLDEVAAPLAEPYRFRAPYLDPRPLQADRVFKNGDVVTWREYEFRVRHLPGQTYFTMGFEATIDGKKCFHTADNFFHADQFTGSGGWSGRNRSWPGDYAKSARMVLDARPDWILAEHGGPYQFDAEDYRRRVSWGEEAAKAADALCLSGQHRIDWNPHRLRVEPLLVRAKPGGEATAHLVADGLAKSPERLRIRVEGRGLVEASDIEATVDPGGIARHPLKLRLAGSIPAGRHVVALRVTHLPEKNGEPWDDPADVFLVVEAER